MTKDGFIWAYFPRRLIYNKSIMAASSQQEQKLRALEPQAQNKERKLEKKKSKPTSSGTLPLTRPHGNLLKEHHQLGTKSSNT